MEKQLRDAQRTVCSTFYIPESFVSQNALKKSQMKQKKGLNFIFNQCWLLNNKQNEFKNLFLGPFHGKNIVNTNPES
jgi:hypothetical protein